MDAFGGYAERLPHGETGDSVKSVLICISSEWEPGRGDPETFDDTLENLIQFAKAD